MCVVVRAHAHAQSELTPPVLPRHVRAWFAWRQGKLADCWLIAALKLVAQSKHHWKLTKLLADEGPDGVVSGRLRLGGKWREITVDKTLLAETVGDETRLVYAHDCSPGPAALWAAFAEKMFAVAYGGYGVRDRRRSSPQALEARARVTTEHTTRHAFAASRIRRGPGCCLPRRYRS